MTVDLSGTRARVQLRALEIARVAADLAVDDTRAHTSRATGALAASIQHTNPELNDTHVTLQITAGEGLDPNYAGFEDTGTGIYGPTGARIFPRNGTVLAFVWPGAGTAITRSNPNGLSFFRSVAGSPGKHYFHEPMPQRWRACLAEAVG